MTLQYISQRTKRNGFSSELSQRRRQFPGHASQEPTTVSDLDQVLRPQCPLASVSSLVHVWLE